MPADVLAQLREASSNVNNNQLKSQLDEVVKSASQSSTSLNALRGIVQALTAGGDDLSGSLEKVVFYFQQYSERAKKAQGYLSAFGGQLNNLDTKKLNDISNALIKIENEQKALSSSVQIFPSVSKSLSNLDKLYKKLKSINHVSSVNVQVSTVQKQGQSFATGGQVHYTPSNTRKAKTGGRFTGKRTGDREIAFVNAGEAIITQRAVKSGAKQVGMSVSSYISSLNSGNLSRIKKGRSFSGGGGAGVDISREQKQVFKSGGYAQKGKQTKQSNISFVKSFIQGGKNDAGEDLTEDHIKELNKLQKSLDSINGDNVSGLLKELNIDLNELIKDSAKLKDFNSHLKQMGVNLEENSKKIKTLKDLQQAYDEQSQKFIKDSLRGMGEFGEYLSNNNSKLAKNIVGFSIVNKVVVDASKSLSGFVTTQASLNRKLAEFNATANAFGANAAVFDKFRSNMNLTREEASKLTETFKTIGVQGNVSFSQINALAQGIKSQFGTLDTSMLQRAVNLVKDLPQGQIDVMINGTGSLDDQANLLANLASGGNLQVAAKLITEGAFGEVQGVTPDMSEKDKKMLQAQATTNKILDEMKSSLFDMVPQVVGMSSIWISAIAPVVTAITGIMSYSRKAGMALQRLRGALKGHAVSVMDVKMGAGGGIQGAIKQNGKQMSGIFGKMGGFLKSFGPMLLAQVGMILGRILWDFGKKTIGGITKKQKQSQGHNASKYKIGNTQMVSQNEVDAKGAGGTLAMMAGGAAIGAAIGSIVPGIGTAIGAGVGAVVGAITGLSVGLYNWIANSEEAQRNNDRAFINKKTLRLIQYNSYYEKQMNSKIGIIQKDVKKQILTMASLDKSLKMLGEGAFSKDDYFQATAAANRNNTLSQMGGSDSSFAFNVVHALSNIQLGSSKDYSYLDNKRKEIVNSDKMDELAKSTMLARLSEEEIKVQKRLIDALNASIAQYQKMPSVIQSAIISSMTQSSMDFQRKNFMGSSGSAVEDAKRIIQSSNKAVSATQEQAMRQMQQVTDQIQKLNERIKKSRIDASDSEKALTKLGFQQSVDSNGNVNEEVVKNNNAIMMDLEKRFTSALSKSDRYNVANAFNIETKKFFEESYNNSKKVEEKWETMGADSKKDMVNTQISQIEMIIEKLSKKRQGMSGKALEEMNTALAMLSDQKKKLVESKGGAGLSAVDMKQILKLTGDNARLGGQAVKFDAIIKEYQKNKDLQKIMTKEQFVNYHKLRIAMMANASAQDAQTLLLESQSKVIKNSIKVYEDAAKNISAAMDAVRNSADVLFNTMMSYVRDKSLSFDSLTKGGPKAFNDYLSSELKTFSASFEGIANAGKLMDGLLAQSDNSYNESVKQIQSSSDLSGQDKSKLTEFLKLQNDRNKAMAKFVRNKDSDSQAQVEVWNQKVKQFQMTNAGLIQKWQKLGVWDTIKNSPKAWGTIIESQLKAQADLKAKYMQFLDSLPERIKKAAQEGFEARYFNAKTDVASSKGRQAELNVDFGGMYNSVKQVAKYAAMERDVKIKAAKQAYQQTIKALDEKLKVATSPKEIEAIQKAKKIAALKGQAQIRNAEVEFAQNTAKRIRQRTEAIISAIGRRNEGLQIQKDLLNSIGAPFEMVLQIEQGIVNLKRKQAEAQQYTLEQMQKRGIKGKLLQEQKLKTAKAQAAVLKSAFGAQRDSLDKMLGKMMGTFNDVGGIFDMESTRMTAKKFGQGYGINGAGMVVQGGADAHNSYKQRVLNNANMAMGGRAGQMMSGHMQYQDFFAGRNQVNEAFKNTNSVIRSQDVNSQNVDNLYVRNFDGLGGGNAQGASKGGFVYPDGKIRAFSKGGPSDPRDNIPALLRKGEFVLTPEQVKNAVSGGEKMFSAFGGLTGDNKEKFLKSILTLLMKFFKMHKTQVVSNKKMENAITKQFSGNNQSNQGNVKGSVIEEGEGSIRTDVIERQLKDLEGLQKKFEQRLIKKVTARVNGGEDPKKIIGELKKAGASEELIKKVETQIKQAGRAKEERKEYSIGQLKKRGATEAQIKQIEAIRKQISENNDNEDLVKLLHQQEDSIVDVIKAARKQQLNAEKNQIKDLNNTAFGSGPAFFGAGSNMHSVTMDNIKNGNATAAAMAWDRSQDKTDLQMKQEQEEAQKKQKDVYKKYGINLEDNNGEKKENAVGTSASSESIMGKNISTSAISSDYDSKKDLKQIQGDDKANKTQKVIGKTLLDMRNDVNKILKVLLSRRGGSGSGSGYESDSGKGSDKTSSSKTPAKSLGGKGTSGNKKGSGTKGGEGTASNTEKQKAELESKQAELEQEKLLVELKKKAESEKPQNPYNPAIYSDPFLNKRTKRAFKTNAERVGKGIKKAGEGAKAVGKGIKAAEKTKLGKKIGDSVRHKGVEIRRGMKDDVRRAVADRNAAQENLDRARQRAQRNQEKLHKAKQVFEETPTWENQKNLDRAQRRADASDKKLTKAEKAVGKAQKRVDSSVNRAVKGKGVSIGFGKELAIPGFRGVAVNPNAVDNIVKKGLPAGTSAQAKRPGPWKTSPAAGTSAKPPTSSAKTSNTPVGVSPNQEGVHLDKNGRWRDSKGRFVKPPTSSAKTSNAPVGANFSELTDTSTIKMKKISPTEAGSPTSGKINRPGFGPNSKPAQPPPGPDGKIPTGRSPSTSQKVSSEKPLSTTPKSGGQRRMGHGPNTRRSNLSSLKTPASSTLPKSSTAPKFGGPRGINPKVSRGAGAAGTAWAAYQMGKQIVNGDFSNMDKKQQAMFIAQGGLMAGNMALPILMRTSPRFAARMGRFMGPAGSLLMAGNTLMEGYDIYKNWDKMSEQQRNHALMDFGANRAVDAAYLINPVFGLAAQGANELRKHYEASNRQIDNNEAVNRNNMKQASFDIDRRRLTSKDPKKWRAMNDANLKMFNSLGGRNTGFTAALKRDREWREKNKEFNWFGISTKREQNDQTFNMKQNNQNAEMRKIAAQLSDLQVKYNLEGTQRDKNGKIIKMGRAQEWFNDPEFKRKIRAASQDKTGAGASRVLRLYRKRLTDLQVTLQKQEQAKAKGQAAPAGTSVTAQKPGPWKTPATPVKAPAGTTPAKASVGTTPAKAPAKTKTEQELIRQKTSQNLRGNQQYEDLSQGVYDTNVRIQSLKNERMAELQSTNSYLYDSDKKGDFVFHNGKYVKYEADNEQHKGLTRYSRNKNENNGRNIVFLPGTNTENYDAIQSQLDQQKKLRASMKQRQGQIRIEARNDAVQQVAQEASQRAQTTPQTAQSALQAYQQDIKLLQETLQAARTRQVAQASPPAAQNVLQNLIGNSPFNRALQSLYSPRQNTGTAAQQATPASANAVKSTATTSASAPAQTAQSAPAPAQVISRPDTSYQRTDKDSKFKKQIQQEELQRQLALGVGQNGQGASGRNGGATNHHITLQLKLNGPGLEQLVAVTVQKILPSTGLTYRQSTGANGV